MDFLDEVMQEHAIVEREISYNGRNGTAYFKRINAAQKLALVKGKKYAYNTGDNAAQTIELDLEENERTQHMLVWFSVCDSLGKQKFKTLGDVQKLDAQLVAALYTAAGEVNKAADATDDAPGEA